MWKQSKTTKRNNKTKQPNNNNKTNQQNKTTKPSNKNKITKQNNTRKQHSKISNKITTKRAHKQTKLQNNNTENGKTRTVLLPCFRVWLWEQGVFLCNWFSHSFTLKQNHVKPPCDILWLPHEITHPDPKCQYQITRAMTPLFRRFTSSPTESDCIH